MNEVGKQKYEITQCQSQEITLSKRIGISCIYFTLMTIDVSCSSRIEKLPSSYCSESAEWKVLHEKKKKKKKTKNLLLLHLVNFTEFRPFYVRYYSVSSRGIFQNCIVGIGLFRLSRSHPLLSWLCLGYLYPMNVS